MSVSASVKAILFDFDGVIADSETLHYQGFAAIADEALGIRLSRSRYDSELIGYDDMGGFAVLCAEAGAAVTEVPHLAARKKHWVAQRLGQVPLVDGARETLATATRLYPWAIVSGALRSEIEAILTSHALPVPAVVVAAEDTPQSKPAADPYLLGAHRMGLPPDRCLAIEDTAAGCSSALAAGCRVVQITAHTHPHPQAHRHVGSHADIPWQALDTWLAA